MTTIYSPTNLTSNTSNGFLIASASSNNADAWLAFNSSIIDYWSPSVSTTGEYLQIDLGVSVSITLVRVMCDTSVNTPTAITIAGSNNGLTFTNVTAFTGLTFTSNTFTDLAIALPTNIQYRFYRLILVNQNGVTNRITSVEFNRTSSSAFRKVTINPSSIKQINTVVDIPYWDVQLERQTKSVSGYATIKTNASGVILRPTQGQIFPRGYPVTSQNIIINSVTAVNVADSASISLKQITGFGGVTPYLANLTAACGVAYQPLGSFCNRLYKDAQDVIWKYQKSDAATWNCTGFVGTGVLVIDLLNSVSFNRACIFQMFDDGKITHIELFSHPSTSNTFPVNTDSNWVSVGSEVAVGAGTIGYLGYQPSNGGISSNPTEINFSTITSRYLKLHCRNTGVLGEGQYIELGGFKLFNV